MKTSFKTMVVLSIVIIVFWGCSNIRPTESRKTLVSSEQAINTLPAPTVTFSPSPTSTIVSITHTATPSVTPTIQPITNIEIKDLLQYRGDCRLPCWWGIEPGRTSGDQANHELTSNGIKLIGSRSEKSGTAIRNYGFDLYVPDLVYNDIEIFSSDELITMIRVKAGSNHKESFWGVWSTYEPMSVLNEYTPDQIWLLIYSLRPSSETGNVIYRLVFRFSEDQTMIEYHGLTKEVDGAYKICPNYSGGGNITPGIIISMGDIEPESDAFQSLDKVSTESVESVIEGIEHTESYCVTSSREYWP